MYTGIRGKTQGEKKDKNPSIKTSIEPVFVNENPTNITSVITDYINLKYHGYFILSSNFKK